MDEQAEGQVCAALARLGIAYTRRAHPPVATVAQARLYEGGEAGLHCKNLFLRNKKGSRFFLAVFEETTPLDLAVLGHCLGVGRLSLASPDRLAASLGVRPGAVGPFGLLNDSAHTVDVLLDARLRGAERLGFHPNVNTATLYLSAEDLLRFLADCGNPWHWVEAGRWAVGGKMEG
jgi:Ala-tRNA(Pro) deacylase